MGAVSLTTPLRLLQCCDAAEEIQNKQDFADDHNTILY